MYIKKILLTIVVIGLVVAAFFANFVYKAMLKPNTAFNNDTAPIFSYHLKLLTKLLETS